MYIQWFVKGISSVDSNGNQSLTWKNAQNLILNGEGLISNWWRNNPSGQITPSDVEHVLTSYNLNRHVHDYQNYGNDTPFISVATGCVERDTFIQQNFIYSAIDTALEFATKAGSYPGVLFYGWLQVSHNPAVEIGSVAEPIRDLNVYHRWSQFQPEGEVTAKINIPANQIQRLEWWDMQQNYQSCSKTIINPNFVQPTPLLNQKEYF